MRKALSRSIMGMAGFVAAGFAALISGQFANADESEAAPIIVAAAGETTSPPPGRLFFIPASAGYGISECFQPGSHCGKIVADSWCQTHGKGLAMAYGKADDITASISATEKKSRQIETGSYVVRCSD